MKKLSLLLSVLLISAFISTGCSSSQPAEPNGTADTSDPIKVGIALPMDHPSLNTIQEAIVDELNAQGIEMDISVKNAQGDPSNISTIISQFIGDGVDVIVPIATPTAQAAAAATKDIPIIFAAVSYPVEAGLVTSYENTDGNITGVTNAIAIDETFELAKMLTPDVQTFGFVYNTGEVNAVSSIERAKEYCDANGLSYKEAIITNTGELQQAAQSLIGKVDALFSPNDNMVASAMPVLASEGIKGKLPVYVGADSMVVDGGFACVGIDYTILGKQVAQMVKRIIVDNEAISDNPVEVVNEYAKMINKTTADEIGIQIPSEQLNTFVIIE